MSQDYYRIVYKVQPNKLFINEEVVSEYNNTTAIVSAIVNPGE